MENQEQIERIVVFLNQVVVKELGLLQHSELSYMPFVLMGQAVEVLGSFLDNKPMKARGQSAKRFSQGAGKLFGGRYRQLNENDYLYDKLRNQMTHTFVPSGDLILLHEENNTNHHKHLDVVDHKLVLISEVFYKDTCQACERLIGLLREGRLKPKNIAFEYEK